MEPTAQALAPDVRADADNMSRCWRWLRRLLDAGLAAAVALIGLIVIAARCVPVDVTATSASHVRVAMFAGLVRTLALQIGCVLLVLALAAAVRRRWRLVLMAMPLLALNLGPALWSYRPRTPPAIAGETVRMMTFNLFYHNDDVAGALAEIRAADPDILLLQECSDRWQAALRPQLRRTYPHSFFKSRIRNLGLAVYSKRPFVEPVECSDFNDYPPAAPLRVVVDIDGRPTAIYNVHLYQPYPLRTALRRRAQVAGIFERLNRETLPTMLIGDFNETETGPLAAEISDRGYTEAFDLGGWGHGATWPDRPLVAWLPGIRIDHIYLDDAFTCTACRVGRGAGSDHRPVIADVGFRIVQ